MLEIDWGTILWQTVNFIIVAVILNYLVFKPIVKKSEAQSKKKAKLMAQTEKNEAESAVELQNIKNRLANFDQELQKIADETYEHNKELQQELLDATREEAEHILQDAVVEARKDQIVDFKQQQSKMIEIIMKLSAETIKKVLPPEVHNNLITELTGKIWDLGKTNMHQVNFIRESLAGRTPVIEVSTPLPLTNEQNGNLIRTFSALADNDVNLEIEMDESLIAGIKVVIGDQIIENSIRSQLNQIESDVEKTLEHIYMDEDVED